LGSPQTPFKKGFIMKEKKFNGWFIYWVVLLGINFGAYVLSVMAGDMTGCVLCAFMILFCGIAIKQNMKTEEK
jgi:hypothetical protein